MAIYYTNKQAGYIKEIEGYGLILFESKQKAIDFDLLQKEKPDAKKIVKVII